MEGIGRLYDHRFSVRERQQKERVWKVLCERYFQRFVPADAVLLDLACGYGEVSRHLRAGRKIAVDSNPEVEAHLAAGVEFHAAEAEALPLADASIDVCFTSNFFEHLPNKAAMDRVLAELLRVLRPGGRLVAMQPNIRFAAANYWDFYDHHLPLSDRSAVEGLVKAGFEVVEVVPRFVPFSTKSPYPKHPALVRFYLALPWVWPLLGKQFVIVGEKPAAADPAMG